MLPSFDKLIESEFVQNCGILAKNDFPDVEASVERLHRLRAAAQPFEQNRDADRPHTVPPWYKTLRRILVEAPFPGEVLSATDRFVRNCSIPDDAFVLFEETPRSLEVLARLACASSWLTQVLMGQTESLRELTRERRTAEMKSREGFLTEARNEISTTADTPARLSKLRQYQRQQILRIGMCDAFGLLDLKFVTLQISLLADAMVQLCLEIACEDCNVENSPFAIIALGKHGGEELNYSSDIDLVLIATRDSPDAQRVARRLIDGLSDQMSSGFLYRVDMRLRPWGDAGPLVSTPDTYEEYLKNDAALWEKQALLKARVIAGAPEPGFELLNRLPELLFLADEESILSNVRHMKGQIEAHLRRAGKLHSEVKLGAGSIRDIEFLVQALQLVHGGHEPRLASANTLDALVRLAEFSVIDVTTYRQLREGYVFLRTIEHALQLLHNLQTHELPKDDVHRDWLARRLDYPSQEILLARFEEHRRAVRRIFDAHFAEEKRASAEVSTSTPRKGSAAVSKTDEDESENLSCQILSSFIQQDDELREKLHNIPWDDVENKDCFIRSTPFEDGTGMRLITIAAVEVSGLTSMLCGLFFACRIDIREGETINGGGESRFGYAVPDSRFMGVFLCEDTSSADSPRVVVPASELEKRLQELMKLQQTEPARVRERLVEMFCERVAGLDQALEPPGELSIAVDNNVATDSTKLRISAHDSFGFFFELSNALTISGFRILHAELGQWEGRIRDTIYVTEAAGGPVVSPARVEELRTAITLIKQFTSWLPSYNDPHQALFRFRDLLKVLLHKVEGEAHVEGCVILRFCGTSARCLG